MRNRARRPWTALLLSPILLAPAGPRSEAAPSTRAPTVESPPSYRWAVVERTIAQEQGDWRVDYRLRLDAAPGPAVTLGPDDLAAAVDGWVSNARVAAHAVPRRSPVKVNGALGGTGLAEVIPGPDEARRCRERLVLRLWPLGAPEPASRPKSTPDVAPDRLPPVTILPGGTLCVRLRLEHDHFLFGPYDPLLGVREVELRLGATTVRDSLPLEREHRHAQARPEWPAPPDDRLDTRHFVSAPDSIHLEAHVPGNQYYRFDDRPIRYATKYKLTFWYRTAPCSEGEFRLRFFQYKDCPSGWQRLPQGDSDQGYKQVGRWTKVERILTTEPDATHLAFDFRLYPGDINVGEAWIDDVRLEPCNAPACGP